MLKLQFTPKSLLFGIFISLMVSGYGNTPYAPIAPFAPQEKAQDDSGSDTDEDDDEAGINSGGVISDHEKICDSGIPDGIKNVSEPTGDIEGFLTIRWEKKSAGEGWTVIPGETLMDYSPPSPITSTTFYRRGCRESVHQPWIYSNVVEKRIVNGIEDVKVTTSNVTCNDGNDGNAIAIVTGGTPGYNFEWTNGDTDATTTELVAGVYAVIVTDENGCKFASDNEEVTQPAVSVTINAVLTVEPSCPGLSNGLIFIEAMDGVAPYEYDWSDGNFGPANFDIAAGSYTVTVTDQLGCTNTIEGLVLGEPEPFKLEDNAEGTSCYGYTDGSAIIEPQGGTAPYMLSWPDGSNAPVRTDLASGTYQVDVVDFNGCNYTESIEILTPDVLAASAYTVNNKVCKATANIVASGGTAPYTFEWEDGSTNGYITDLCPGLYTVEITDINGCQTSESLNISTDYTSEDISIEVIVNPYFKEGNIVIKLPFNSFADVSVYTVAGKLVEEFANTEPETDQKINITLDMDKYSNGMYLLRVETEGLSTTEKVVIARP